MTRFSRVWSLCVAAGAALAVGASGVVAAQTPAQPPVQVTATTPTAPAARQVAPPIVPPADYVIGAEDVLFIHFRYDPDLTALAQDMPVRPDGKISLPLIYDVMAAGLSVEQLRVSITKKASEFIKDDPAVTVQVKAIKSRKYTILGEVNKRGEEPLLGPTNIVQAIARAGGFTDYAKKKEVRVLRTENGRETAILINFEDLEKGRNLEKNISLKPGDQIIVR